MGGGGNTLRVYRRLLGLARRMQPAERRADALKQIREGFRQHAQERDEERCVVCSSVYVVIVWWWLGWWWVVDGRVRRVGWGAASRREGGSQGRPEGPFLALCIQTNPTHRPNSI